jgi:hypothetical protein
MMMIQMTLMIRLNVIRTVLMVPMALVPLITLVILMILLILIRVADTRNDENWDLYEDPPPPPAKSEASAASDNHEPEGSPAPAENGAEVKDGASSNGIEADAESPDLKVTNDRDSPETAITTPSPGDKQLGFDEWPNLLATEKPQDEERRHDEEELGDEEELTDSAEVAQCRKEDYFGPIANIPAHAIVGLAKRVLSQLGHSIDNVYVKGEASGSFNLCKFINTDCPNLPEKGLVIKVPGSGWGSYWTEERETVFLTEVATMKLIHEKTDGQFPVPKLLDHDSTFHNELGVPYIMMECMPGVSALEVWFDHGPNPCWRLAPESEENPEKDALRQWFLWSLAEKMAMLRSIEFPQTGMVYSRRKESHSCRRYLRQSRHR